MDLVSGQLLAYFKRLCHDHGKFLLSLSLLLTTNLKEQTALAWRSSAEPRARRKANARRRR